MCALTLVRRLHTKYSRLMENGTPFENWRPGRKYPKGVTYDNRIKKFVAYIQRGKKRIRLGTFETASAAAVAYVKARAAQPVSRKRVGAYATIDACWQDFVKQADRDEKGHVVVGNIFVGPAPDEQPYELVEIDVRNGKRGVWVFYHWEAACAFPGCPERFETTTRGRAKHLRGMTRTCPLHRGQFRSKKSMEDLV